MSLFDAYVSDVSMRTTSSMGAKNVLALLNQQVHATCKFSFSLYIDLRIQAFTSSNSVEEFIKSGGQSKDIFSCSN